MDIDEEVARLSRLANLLDSQFRLPGTNISFGLDALLGLLPVVGDTAGALPALYLVHRARKLGVPNELLIQMLANVIIDLAVGAIPVLGDIFDVTFKANRRNVDLLRWHVTRVRAAGRAR